MSIVDPTNPTEFTADALVTQIVDEVNAIKSRVNTILQTLQQSISSGDQATLDAANLSLRRKLSSPVNDLSLPNLAAGGVLVVDAAGTSLVFNQAYGTFLASAGTLSAQIQAATDAAQSAQHAADVANQAIANNLSASVLPFTPAGNIAATTIQAAVQELDSEKLAITGGTITGNLTVNGAIAVGSTSDFGLLISGGVRSIILGIGASLNYTVATKVLGFVMPSGTQVTLTDAVGLESSVDATTPNGLVRKSQVQSLVAASSVGKNRVINGSMEVSQRGDLTIAAVAANVPGVFGGPDRFFVQHSFTAGTLSLTQTQSTMSLTSGRKVRTLKQTVTAATTENFGGSRYFAGIATTLENANIFDFTGQQITVSFWAKASVAGTYSVALRRGALDGGSAASRCFVSNVILAANTPTFVTLTTPALPFDLYATGDNLTFHFGAQNTSAYQVAAGEVNTWGSGGNICAPGWTSWLATTGATLEIGELQIESGSAATAFERRLFGDVLSLCKRYYAATYEYGTPPGAQSTIGAVRVLLSSTGAFHYRVQFPVGMRASPVLTCYSPVSGAANKYYDNGTSADVSSGIVAGVSSTGGGITKTVSGTANGAADFHWTAAAEITS